MDTQLPVQSEPPQGQASKPAGPQIAVAVAGIFGAALGSYCGWQLVVSLALAFGVGWLLTRVPASPAVFRFAWALLAAQALWMAADTVLTGEWSRVALPMLVLVAGLVWLWVRSGLAPVISSVFMRSQLAFSP